jgi:hypothetical protein
VVGGFSTWWERSGGLKHNAARVYQAVPFSVLSGLPEMVIGSLDRRVISQGTTRGIQVHGGGEEVLYALAIEQVGITVFFGCLCLGDA